MKRFLLHLCLLFTIFAAALFAQAPFTLEQVMSAPFSSELVVAKSVPRIAWVVDARGARNIFVASAPDWKSRQITHYPGDDGQSIAALAITPDGSTLVYARGTESNEDGRAANPESLPVQPKQQVWAIRTDGVATPVLLGEMGCAEEGCEDIRLSPNGKLAVWAAKKQLWIAPVDAVPTPDPAKIGSESGPAKQLTNIRGDVSEPRWSPDGNRLAVRVDRKSHSLIAVLHLAPALQSLELHHIVWMAPSTERDLFPRWSPDGRQLAFVRTPGLEQRLPLIPQRIIPWSIQVANAETGSGREIWHSGSTQRDSLPEFLAGGFLFPTPDRIVFVSDHDNWPHLYAISPAGGSATLLTPGAFSIEDVAPGKDPSTILYSSNQADSDPLDVDRRHIWSVSLAGGPPQPLSRGETIEWNPVQASDGAVLALGSSAQLPGLPQKLGPAGRQPIAGELIPAEFPARQLLTPTQVIFKSDDGFTIHGQLFTPPQCTGKRCPALLFTHGGPPRQMLLGWHYMDYYANAYAANQYLASRGYVVLSVNYRLGIMYGHDFQYPEHTVWRGADEYKDVQAGAHLLQSLPNVDPRRIGLWGGSYGGFLTAMGLAHNSDIFKAGVDFHGVHDWSVFLPSWEENAKDAPDLKDAIELARKSSPVSAIATWKSPVLLLHGDDDRNVPFAQDTDLAQRLRQQGVRFDEIIYPDEIHGFLLWRDWIRSYRAMQEFFDQQLK